MAAWAAGGRLWGSASQQRKVWVSSKSSELGLLLTARVLQASGVLPLQRANPRLATLGSPDRFAADGLSRWGAKPEQPDPAARDALGLTVPLFVHLKARAGGERVTLKQLLRQFVEQERSSRLELFELLDA